MRSCPLRLLASNRAEFEQYIDESRDAEDSIVLRYRNAVELGDGRDDAGIKEWLGRTSIREGARIFRLATFRDVEIFILDETSRMHTRTLKSVDGCVTTARCKHAGHQRVIFETGGNTGAPLTEYGQRAGLETYCFLPEENLYLLKSSIFESDRAHLIAVKEPGMVKPAARRFGEMHGLKHIPEVEWRFEAATFRGMFLLEHLLSGGGFDWMVQVISAAFGPVGIYGVLRPFAGELGGVPRFLGVQQAANCPMYRSLKGGGDPAEVKSTGDLLTRVMYDSRPHSYGTTEALREILTNTDGDLTTIDTEEFTGFLNRDLSGGGVLELLSGRGVNIAVSGKEVVEKTGLISLAGGLKAIEAGTISAGSRILCCLTSGESDADGQAVPEKVIAALDDLEDVPL